MSAAAERRADPLTEREALDLVEGRRAFVASRLAGERYPAVVRVPDRDALRLRVVELSVLALLTACGWLLWLLLGRWIVHALFALWGAR